MKVLFTIDSMKAGGAERVVSTLSNQFVEMGFHVTILMVSYDKKESFYDLNKEVALDNLLKTGEKRSHYFSRAKKLERRIKEIKPDVIIAFLPHICIYTSFACKKMKTPIVLCERNDPHKYNLIMRLLLKRVFKKADGCVFQTNDAMQWYGKSVANKSVVIFNPINIIKPSLPEQNIVRNSTIFSVGRLVEQKNFKLLIESFDILTRTEPSYCLKIYGEGPLRSKLDLLIHNKGLEDKVFLVGNDSSWQQKEYNSALFVLSSDYEGMPNALMEAMALGIPCVATDCPIGGPRELINDGENGYLVKTNNKSELARIIIEALHNPLISKNYDIKYSPKSIALQWIEYINKLL